MVHQDYPGLTTPEAEALLLQYGPNDVSEKGVGLKKFLAPLYSPISLMLLGAAFLSRLNGRIFDMYFILALYVVNFSIQKWQEHKADKAIEELQSKLSFDVWALRDGAWTFVNAKSLVPGDHIRVGLGGIIPADGVIISSKNLSLNEAVLTGESMPKDKKAGDGVFSGSFISTGSLETRITATGKNTGFGKTIFSIEQPSEKSILEKDILTITRFLTYISVAAVLLLTASLLLRGQPIRELLTLDLSLVIAGIPIALPAVMAIILSIGAAGLAKKQVVVRRLSALEDLANVNLLLTDKTGTLTKNEIRIVNVISYQDALSADDIVELAAWATSPDIPNAIDTAILKKMKDVGRNVDSADVINFVPYDSERKRTTALVKKGEEKVLVSLGAPQIIEGFCDFSSNESQRAFKDDIAKAASEGYRVLALAVTKKGVEEKNLRMAGLLYLADPLEESSKDTIRFMREHGILVKMVTGDNKVIAERIAKELELQGTVLSVAGTRRLIDDPAAFQKEFKNVAVFSEILPKDKYELVKTARARYVVASTGDGINDLPALKVANIGIAVSGAVSALKSLADMVLLGQNIAAIKDAIFESRKIFVRLYNYSVYRISESFRLVVTILILGLWYGFYPLVPLQLILLAFLNDIPIISLAVDRVKISIKPSEVNTKERFTLSLLFGSVGVLNSILLFFLMTQWLHFQLPVIQTMFFLKLTVSGHALIFVAHTKERWFRFLPAKEVIIATLATQAVATMLAITGFMMPAPIPPWYAFFVWVWALFWMQIGEYMKDVQKKLMGV